MPTHDALSPVTLDAVAIGTVFEVATLAGVDLFGIEPQQRPVYRSRERDRLALLPSRVRTSNKVVDDDF